MIALIQTDNNKFEVKSRVSSIKLSKPKETKQMPHTHVCFVIIRQMEKSPDNVEFLN